jgi:hypothetical protein
MTWVLWFVFVFCSVVVKLNVSLMISHSANLGEEFLNEMCSHIPLGRLGKPGKCFVYSFINGDSRIRNLFRLLINLFVRYLYCRGGCWCG